MVALRIAGNLWKMKRTCRKESEGFGEAVSSAVEKKEVVLKERDEERELL